MSQEKEAVIQNDSSESEDNMDEDEETNEKMEVEKDDRPNVYLPGQPLNEGEELICDKSAYKMLHQAQTGAPCLSFDIIKDNLGDNREEFPLTAYIVAGTQSAKAHANNVILMKLSNLHKIQDDDEDDDGSDNDDDSKLPQMTNTLIRHLGCVNRIRSTRFHNSMFVATWSELGRVNIWDLSKQLEMLDDPQKLSAYNKNHEGNKVSPAFTFTGHQQEGFAIDWCQMAPGVLATGDCRRDIHKWKPSESTWLVDQRPLVGHTNSVEDLQWSPNEQNVLASCSVDKSIRIWDTRAAPHKACMLTTENAHQSDVNVISWNKKEPFIVSGGDDGFLHIWDLRQFQSQTPVATFKHHTEPVTTVEWYPNEATIFASGGADDQTAIWDLSVEKDTDEQADDIQEIPPQLLFIHQGQKDVKELHWHPQLPGVIISTAHSGFNIFRTISV